PAPPPEAAPGPEWGDRRNGAGIADRSRAGGAARRRPQPPGPGRPPGAGRTGPDRTGRADRSGRGPAPLVDPSPAHAGGTDLRRVRVLPPRPTGAVRHPPRTGRLPHPRPAAALAAPRRCGVPDAGAARAALRPP